MTNSPLAKCPVVVGPVSVDVLYRDVASTGGKEVYLQFGGVCHNITCTLAAHGLSPVFMSPRFSGDIGECLPGHLSARGVRWSPTKDDVPLSLFTANIGPTGSVSNELFIDGGAARVLDAATFRQSYGVFRQASAIVSCSDLSLNALEELAEISRLHDVPFCLVSTSVEEVKKIRLKRKADIVSLNIKELNTLFAINDTELSAIARNAVTLVSDNGACIVTLGEMGSLICTPYENEFIYQSVPLVDAKSTVGAGDALFAIVLADRLLGSSWADAIHHAAGIVCSFIQADPQVRNQQSQHCEKPYSVAPYERLPL